MFAEVRKAGVGSISDLQTFRDGWQSQQTRELFARSRQNLERDGDLSKAGEVERYGWNEQR